jgi:hypothetical protein
MRSSLAFILAAGLIALMVGGCVAETLSQPSPEQVARAQTLWPSVNVGRLESGRTLCSAHCASCHAPPDPRAYTADAWPAEVARMAPRAHLDPNQVEEITRYLQTVAMR